MHCCRTYSFPCVASHLFRHKNCGGGNQKIKQRPLCLITYVWRYQSLCEKAFMFYHDITNWEILSVAFTLSHKLDYIIFVSFFDNFSILVTLFWLSLLSSHLFTRKSHFSFVRFLIHWPTCLNVYTTTKIPPHSSKTAFTHDSGSRSVCWALLCWNWSDKLLLPTGQQVSLVREQSAPPPLTVCTVLLPSCGHRDRGSAARWLLDGPLLLLLRRWWWYT